MSKRVWHKGPPPHIGWWNASDSNVDSVWRWWNGSHWSWPAWPSYSETEAFDMALGSDKGRAIKWTNFYPKKARVPRSKQ